MTESEIKIEIESIFRRVLNFDLNTELHQIEKKNYPRWDSLRQAELVIRLQRRFGIQFKVEEILSMNSFDLLTQTILNKKRE